MTAAQLDQKMGALALANEIRMSNARLRRDIGALSYSEGCERVADLLASPVGPVASLPIARLLKCINRVGDDGMIKFVRHAGIFSTTKRVRALTVRQRQALIWALRNRVEV